MCAKLMQRRKTSALSKCQGACRGAEENSDKVEELAEAQKEAQKRLAGLTGLCGNILADAQKEDGS